ncbi:MAG: DUF262 domain-containing protein [Deltaproteobacteria bacterium]|nr:DUF262 domain-containing protein [Deltaproteobacteria bacterium]
MNTAIQAQEQSEEVEGLGGEEDRNWGDYPIDTLLIRNESRTIHDILRRIEKGSFVMNPDFQRDFVWPEDKQSKLIESVLLRIPLPVFYLAEDENGRMIVVDGLQRLTTFQRFVSNELRLKLPEREDLNNKTFDSLPSKFQNRIEDSNLILYVIDAKVPEQAKLDIFERVNSGMPLTRQQMRNSLYMGPATQFLREEAHSNEFLEATRGSLNKESMRDREFVNRFCAFFLLGIDDYRGDMDEFLAKALLKMNAMDSKQLLELSNQFRLSMINNQYIFGRSAFRKHTKESPGRIINASLWDVMSTVLSQCPHSVVQTHAEKIKSAFFGLIEDGGFNQAITYSTNHTKQVRFRFEMAQKAFKEVLGDSQD